MGCSHTHFTLAFQAEHEVLKGLIHGSGHPVRLRLSLNHQGMLRRKDRGSGQFGWSHTDRATWLRLWNNFIETFAPDVPLDMVSTPEATDEESARVPPHTRLVSYGHEFFKRGLRHLDTDDAEELDTLRINFQKFCGRVRGRGGALPKGVPDPQEQRQLFYSRLWGTRKAKRNTPKAQIPQFYFGSIAFHLLDDILLPDLLLPTLQVSSVIPVVQGTARLTSLCSPIAESVGEASAQSCRVSRRCLENFASKRNRNATFVFCGPSTERNPTAFGVGCWVFQFKVGVSIRHRY